MAEEKQRWYVVQCEYASDTSKACRNWTVSRDPNKPGWETDCGYPGYGLTYAQAKELADAANKCRD